MTWGKMERGGERERGGQNIGEKGKEKGMGSVENEKMKESERERERGEREREREWQIIWVLNLSCGYLPVMITT